MSESLKPKFVETKVIFSILFFENENMYKLFQFYNGKYMVYHREEHYDEIAGL